MTILWPLRRLGRCTEPFQVQRNNHLLGLHIHEKPFLTDELALRREVIQRGETEAGPSEVLDQSLFLVGVAVNADDESIAREMVNFTEFEKCHQSVNVSENYN